MICPRRTALLAPLLLAAFSGPLAWGQTAAPQAKSESAADRQSAAHRPSRTYNTPIGDFDGQSDIGSAKSEGTALYDTSAKRYSVTSAGYNTTYTREEFRFLWKKMSGDVSVAAGIAFPDPNGYDGRKAVLAIRQGLEDDSKEAVVAVYGSGVFAVGQRPQDGKPRRDETYRVWGTAPERPASAILMPRRVALEKRGDAYILYVSIQGEPMHPFGAPLILHMNQPFYVGIGFCSNLPDKSDNAVFSNVVVENLPRHTASTTR
jgi:hypothetical protein